MYPVVYFTFTLCYCTMSYSFGPEISIDGPVVLDSGFKKTITLLLKLIAQATTAESTNVRSNNDTSQSRYVFQDKEIIRFIIDTYKRGVEFLNVVKNIVNGDVNINKTIEDYRNSYRNYVKETKDTSIKSKHRYEKQVLNIIDTSNTLLTKLLSEFIEITRDTINNKTRKVIIRELEKNIAADNQHACEKFKICNREKALTRAQVKVLKFSDFFDKALLEIVKNDQPKIKEAFDAFVHYLKRINMTQIMDIATRQKLRENIKGWKNMNETALEGGLVGLKHRNSLLKYLMKDIAKNPDKKVSKDIYNLMETLNEINIFLDILNENIKLSYEWSESLSNLKEWRKQKRDDIGPIMKGIVTNLAKIIYSWNSETCKSVKKKLEEIVFLEIVND